ncbi:MAG: lysophospholipid acyltransferase family protein [Candidatus Cloacimonetes bacterium]|nr:lysophospholipid acyltransferase family protein [Candidatus Cloacimonadota bacterium]
MILSKLFTLLRKTWHFFWHLSLVADFFLHALFIRLLNHNPIILRQKQVHNTNRISKKFLKAFGITLKINHPERLKQLSGQSYLAVANHVSYTDIILLSSIENYAFITSVEMGNNPFLGNITREGGCLFTDRKKFVSLPKEIEKFADTIKQGFKVMLFPEGTSTNGETVKEFRKSLFQVAILADCPVLPFCVKYLSLDGKIIDSANRDILCWYGDMDFAPHFMKLLGHTIEVEIDVLEPVYAPHKIVRQELSNGVYSQIMDCYHKNQPTLKHLSS